VADIRPFKGIRPRPDLVELIACPPYDVLSSAEARELAGGNSLSFLHVNKAEIDLPPDSDTHSDEVYKLSASAFSGMIGKGTLIRDETECLYVYRITVGEHVQTGLAVAASVADFESGVIKKHELTRREKEDDRARHVEILQANAGPVLFTYKAEDRIRKVVNQTMTEQDPVYDFDADGVNHALWVLSDELALQEIVSAFADIPALYVADGHHRSAAAFRARDLMKAKNPNHTGDEAYNYFLAVLFPDDELSIMGYHRVVKDLNGLSSEELLARVGEKFNVSEAGQPAPLATHEFTMYLDGKWHSLTAKPGTFSESDPVLSLDASILQENLLAPLLGIADPRTDNRIDFVGGIRGTEELERRCGVDMRVAFALYPVTVEQLMAIADSNAIMPPKSTWFEPKLRSGIVVHSISE
jgi:uncharacterized protein (DUF1015 family)